MKQLKPTHKKMSSFEAVVGAAVEKVLTEAGERNKSPVEVTEFIPYCLGMTPVTITYTPSNKNVVIVARTLKAVPKKYRPQFWELVKLSGCDIELVEKNTNIVICPKAAEVGQILSYVNCGKVNLDTEWAVLLYGIKTTCWELQRHIIALDELMSGADLYDASEWFWRPDEEVEDYCVENFMPFPDTRKTMKDLHR